MSQELWKHIYFERATRQERLASANWVMSHPETIPELIKWCFVVKDPRATKAAYVLEMIAVIDSDVVQPQLGRLISGLDTPIAPPTARAIAHVLEILILKYRPNEASKEILNQEQNNRLLEISFDWLLNDLQTSTKARAMTIIYEIGKHSSWAHQALKVYLEDHIMTGSPGFQARGKTILRHLKKP